MTLHSENFRSRFLFRICSFALICLAFVIYLGKANETLLRGIDSNIHALASLSVTAQANRTDLSWFDRVRPSLPMPDSNHAFVPFESDRQALSPSESFNDHPFFYFYLNGWVMRLFGPSAWSARLLTATFSVGCVFMTLLLGSLLHSRVYGMVAAFLLLIARDIILTGATVSLDPPMLFFILLSFIFWLKRKWILLGITCGFGLWIKTPVVLLVFPVALLDSLLFTPHKKDWNLLQWIRTNRSLFLAGLLAALIGTGVWIILGLSASWQFVQDYWLRQVWGTAIGGRSHSPLLVNTDPWSVLKMLRTGFLPSLPFLVIAVVRIGWVKFTKSTTPLPRVLRISFLAIAVVVAFITPMRFRMDYYFNPIFPFLALISAYSISDLVKKSQALSAQLFLFATLGLLAFLLATPTPLAPETFVALKHFLPYLQSSGKCSDRVLVIPGGEPVGSAHDLSLVINFYTNHPVDIQECRQIDLGVKRTSGPSWIFSSLENWNQCLSEKDKKAFAPLYQVGNQLLAQKISGPSARRDSGLPLDLGVLERELAPTVDCLPPKFPKDRYHIGF